MSNSHVLPPYSNTGAQNTYQESLRACVDWLQVTFFFVHDVHQIIGLIGLKSSQFFSCPTGKYGYKSQLRFGHISIYHDGTDDMGIHLELSGQGCREYESYNVFSWWQLFSLFHLFKHRVTRLDIAIDDFYGYFTIKQIKRKIRDAEVRSLFRSAIEIRKSCLNTGQSQGDTIYFGSASSMIQVRMYDKYLERLSAGKEIEKGITFWLRTEIQSRDDRAHALAQILTDEDILLKDVISGTLKRYLNFIVRDNDKNKARWKVCGFWNKYLGDVEKLKLTQVAPDKTIETAKNWVNRQVDTTLAMLYEAYKEDLSLMHKMIHDGRKKLKDKHFDMLKRYWLERNGGDLTVVNARLEELEKKVIVTRMMDFEEFLEYETKNKKSPAADDNSKK